MISVIILNRLRNEIFKTFKNESLKIYSLFEELKKNPNKGKVLGHVGNISIRELRFKSFRFYFIVDNYKLYLYNKQLLEELLIMLVRMSKKHNQQSTIDEIKRILFLLGEQGF